LQAMLMTASICGNKTKADSPYMPVTFEASVADGIKSYRAGAAQLHIHGRDHDGNHTFDPAVYGALIERFRAECPEAIIQASAGDTYHDVEGLLIPLLKLKPDFLSLAAQETREETMALLAVFDQYGVRPVVECFDMEKTRQAVRMFDDGLFAKPLSLEFVFEGKDKGRPFSALASELMEVEAMCRGKAIVWSICGGANHEPAAQALAVALGGHLRTGLEDRQKGDDGAYFTESLATVLPAMQISALVGRKPATLEQARELLGV